MFFILLCYFPILHLTFWKFYYAWQNIFDKCTEILAEVHAQSEKIVEAVKQAIDAKAWVSGHMASDKLTDIMNIFKTQLLQEQQEKLDMLREEASVMSERSAAAPARRTKRTDTVVGGGCIYNYGVKFYLVYQGF